ncbi:MAG TPA: hypothetical protein VN611_11995 [Patescibacteria group bacterium]|nr:hypothetical protein [Patescibacteria group bacterium]
MSNLRIGTESNGVDIQLLRERLHLNTKLSPLAPLASTSAAPVQDTAAPITPDMQKALQKLVKTDTDTAAKDAASTETVNANPFDIKLTTEGMWESCLAEVWKKKGVTSTDADKSLSPAELRKNRLSSPGAIEDIAAAYQLVRSRYAGKYESDKLDSSYMATAAEIADNTTSNFAKVFNAKFSVYNSYDPEGDVPRPVLIASPYQKELTNTVAFDDAAMHDRIMQFSTTALETVKSCSEKAAADAVGAKVSAALSALGGDAANVNQLAYNTFKNLGSTVQSLPDLTKFTESDAETAASMVKQWSEAISSLSATCPELSEKITSALKAVLETFKKTWSFVNFNKETVKGRETTEKKLKEAEEQYKRLLAWSIDSPPSHKSDQIELAGKIVATKKLIKALNRELKLHQQNLKNINNHPDLITNSDQYNRLNGIDVCNASGKQSTTNIR